jgi:Cupin-like domain
MQAIKEWYDVDTEKFAKEIVAAREPAILRGIGSCWPLVQHSKDSMQSLVDYLIDLDNDQQVMTVTAPPEVLGRLGYKEGSKEFNHHHSMEKLPLVLTNLLNLINASDPPAIWLGGLPANDHLPRLRKENEIDLVPADASPHLTICNAVTVPPHIDAADNVAIVVAGRRKFTLFPPEQVSNLYIGPLDITPAGVPISLVSQDAPDLERYPRFREALRSSFVAELGPGDGIYIPYLWWHGVQSLDRFNMLVNFWWYSDPIAAAVPWGALLNASYELFRNMPLEHRKAWKPLYEYWVFGTHGDPTEHLPSGQRSSPPSGEVVVQLRDSLLRLLS